MLDLEETLDGLEELDVVLGEGLEHVMRAGREAGEREGEHGRRRRRRCGETGAEGHHGPTISFS